MDLTIPGGMGGKEAIERLREIDPGIKAIVSSGYSNDPIMSEYRKYGFRGVISKPYKIEDLSEIVGRVTNEGE
jgi:DNA-binding NarL/FixJ family response regulator